MACYKHPIRRRKRKTTTLAMEGVQAKKNGWAGVRRFVFARRRERLHPHLWCGHDASRMNVWVAERRAASQYGRSRSDHKKTPHIRRIARHSRRVVVRDIHRTRWHKFEVAALVCRDGTHRMALDLSWSPLTGRTRRVIVMRNDTPVLRRPV